MANFPSRQNPDKSSYPSIAPDPRRTAVHQDYADPLLWAQLDHQKARRSIRRMKTLTAVATTVILIAAVQHFGPRIWNHSGRKPTAEAPPTLPKSAVAPSSLPTQKGPETSAQKLLQRQDLLTASKEEVISAIQEPGRDIDLAHASERAKAGDPDAQYGMGVRFANGYDVPQNFSSAMTWFMKAERGHPEAQLKLALGYMKGIGVPQDEEQAVMWLKRAANNDNSWAQHALSSLYIAGHAVPRDYVRAYTWAKIASENDGNNNDDVGRLKSQMSSMQVADAEHRISIWRLHSRQNISKSPVNRSTP